MDWLRYPNHYPRGLSFPETHPFGTAPDNRVDYVIMGCPHYSVNELGWVAQLWPGRKVNPATALWVMTSDPQYYIAEKSGIITALQEAGAIIVRDTCPMNAALDWSGKTVMTDSGKVAQYAPAHQPCEDPYGACGSMCRSRYLRTGMAGG